MWFGIPCQGYIDILLYFLNGYIEVGYIVAAAVKVLIVGVCDEVKKGRENCNFRVNYGRWAGCGQWVVFTVFFVQICRHSFTTNPS